jgi:hypothetical protein
MGVIDKTIHKLACHTCSISEEQRILDNGSNWGGSSWQDGVEFTRFDVLWRGGGKIEPSIVVAKCKQCGNDVEHQSIFGGL